MSGVRKRVIDYLRLLASPSEQRKYKEDVPIADVPGELICGFDDFYHPKNKEFLDSFTENELRDLAEIFGLLRLASKTFFKGEDQSLNAFQKNREFRLVMNLAKQLCTSIK
jgi:hypothetical protein